MLKLSVAPMHPATFRDKHKLHRKEIVKISGLPLETLKNYLATPGTSRHCDTPESVQILFGLLDEKLSKTG